MAYNRIVNADVIIVGAGPGGLAAAVWCRRFRLRTIVVERAGTPGGQALEIAHPVDDYPGLRAPEGRALAQAFLDHARALGAQVLTGLAVESLLPAPGGIGVKAGAATLWARRLILATGARPRRLGVPGEAEMIARGEVWRGSRHAARFSGLPVAVIGGGDRAVQNALLLAQAGASVTLVHRSPRFRARREFLAPALAHPGIRVVTGTVSRILGRDRVEGIEIAGAAGPAVVPAAGVFVYIGMEPASELLAGLADLEGDGRVRTDADGRTTLPQAYAVGDVRAAPEFRSITTAVGHAMAAAKAIILDLDGEETGKEEAASR